MATAVYLLAFWLSGDISSALGARTSSIDYDLLNRLLRGPGAGHHLRLDLNAAVHIGNPLPGLHHDWGKLLASSVTGYASMCDPAPLPSPDRPDWDRQKCDQQGSLSDLVRTDSFATIAKPAGPYH